MLTENLHTIINLADPYPERTRRITTSLALRPEHHLHIARLALDLGLDRASLIRRGLVAAGLIPTAAAAVDGNHSEVEGE